MESKEVVLKWVSSNRKPESKKLKISEEIGRDVLCVWVMKASVDDQVRETWRMIYYSPVLRISACANDLKTTPFLCLGVLYCKRGYIYTNEQSQQRLQILNHGDTAIK